VNRHKRCKEYISRHIPQGRPVVQTIVGVQVHEPGEVGQGALSPTVQGTVYLGVGVGVGVVA
jgi:hypothetical protein